MRGDGVHLAARALSRGLFIAGVVGSGLVLIIALAGPMLEAKDRLLLTGLGLISPVGFAIGVWLFIGRKPYLARNSDFCVRTVVATIILFVPVGYMLARYSMPWLMTWYGWGFLAGLLALLAIPIPALEGTASVEDIGRAAMSHVLRVMWWTAREGAAEDTRKLVTGLREKWYADRDALEQFQASWCGRQREAAAVVAAVPNNATVRVILDVGGGDGELTAMVLHKLRNAAATGTPLDVFMVDPVDWSNQYVGSVQDAGTRAVVKVGEFGSAERVWNDQRYDLVMAIHSLYGICDRSKSRHSLIDAVRRLMSLRNESGVLVVGLASRMSRAYFFKRQALALVLGEEIEDLAAEDLSLLDDLASASQVVVDHVLDMSRQLAEFDEGNELPLVRWLRYFLRANLIEGDELTTAVVDLLRSYVQEVASLPEDLILVGEMPGRDPNTLVLPHKTVVWSVQAPRFST